MGKRPYYATRAEAEVDPHPYSPGDWLFLIALFGWAVVVLVWSTLGLSR